MIKKTMTYTDYNGVERTEDFYFNLTKAEIVEWEYSTEGGLFEVLDKLTKAKESTKIIKYFKDIILKSYGEKSDDGKRFVKSKEISEAFSHTEAYDQLYMELFTDSGVASEFIKGILPKDFGDDFDKQLKAMESGHEAKVIDVQAQISQS